MMDTDGKYWCSNWTRIMCSCDSPENKLVRFFDYLKYLNREQYNDTLLVIDPRYYVFLPVKEPSLVVQRKGEWPPKIGEKSYRNNINPYINIANKEDEDARLVNMSMRYMAVLEVIERVAVLSKYFRKTPCHITYKEICEKYKDDKVNWKDIDNAVVWGTEKYIELLGFDLYGDEHDGKMLSREALKLFRKERTKQFDPKGIGYEDGLISTLDEDKKAILNAWDMHIKNEEEIKRIY